MEWRARNAPARDGNVPFVYIDGTTITVTRTGESRILNGVEKCVTNAVSALDVGYASLPKTYVIHGEALFGANVRDNKAKVRIELVPIPPAE